jgi:NtrC-family two-component system response regulator AlgB
LVIETLARMIHGWSGRAAKPFGVIPCPSLPQELLESALFGHVRGAFTSAVRDQPGRVATCDGGTLLLDEIGDLPPALQPKLLRFAQDREYERVGDATTRRADVRLITATHVDLKQRVAQKQFREDLFYRLNVIVLEVPPLRERRADLLPLAEQLLAFFRRNGPPLRLSAAAGELLVRYAWPGNIRELRNVLERAAILCTGGEVGLDDLPATLHGAAREIALGDPVSLDALEEAHIRKLLSRGHSLEQTAAILNIDAATLWRKRKRYGI